MPKEWSIRQIRKQRGEICDRLLRSLPAWFGIEEAIRTYVREVEEMPMLGAVSKKGEVIGFLSLKRHNRYAAEIHLMAIAKAWHRKGVGRALVKAAERYLKEKNYHFVTVKTLSPVRRDAAYAKTRKFYLASGFLPIEEFKNLWGEKNPCLMLAKCLF